MKTWNEVVTESYINGTKLSKEVVDTENNSEKITLALDSLRKVIDNLNEFRNILIKTKDSYEEAKNKLDIKTLTSLNSEAKKRNAIIDDNFELTLNALSAKRE
jgi:hypothetical protein